MNRRRPRYRIVTRSGCFYQAQVRYAWWAFWLTVGHWHGLRESAQRDADCHANDWMQGGKIEPYNPFKDTENGNDTQR